nr:MAG: hypothetical protein 2 [Marnaviridae sp.]
MKCPQCDRSMQFSIGTVQQVRCDSCLDRWKCHIQADETLLAPEVPAMAMTEHETTTFVDSAQGVDIGHSSIANAVDEADAVTIAGLTDFLSRPVRISSFTWNQSDSVGVGNTFSPWYEYFNNANIKYKLNNFAFLRANLKLKFVINASPFLYGSMRACYQPLPAFKGSTVLSGTAAGISNSEFIPYSQQPGVWLKPQHSEGAEMTLPFFYPRAYLRAQVSQDFIDMGTLRMVRYSTLRSANGATGQGVTVQVYAWAEDVVLAGPSVGLALQADEYGVGPVSGPASTVAMIAGKLRSVPVIGKFATATEMGAKAVAGIAKLFGFTNVPVIEPTLPYRPSAFPQMASPEIGYPVEKLTLDSKNELAIDPSVIGLSSHDELAIQNFATKQSFLVTTTWSTATAVDTPLFTTKVTPSLTVGTQTQGTIFQFTPLGLVSELFRSWRGDIIFTFRFIASPFHKGRVRISYDPFNSDIQNTADTGPTTFNKIVDLGQETEVDVRVPYQQALAWCYTYLNYNSLNFQTSPTPNLAFTDTFDNGLLSVKVLTQLTAPVSTSTVDMQVFVRGADNIEFANPKNVFNTMTALALQSEEYSEKREGQEMTVGTISPDTIDERSRQHFGENVGSLRVLLRRSNLVDMIVPGTNVTGTGAWQIRQTRFPPYYGYDAGGWSTALGTVAPASNFQFNFVKVMPWHLITNCFIAQRGSMHWHYNWTGQDVTMTVSRRTSGTVQSQGYPAVNSGSASVYSRSFVNNLEDTPAATAVVNQKTNAGLSVSIPNYSVFKFESTDPRNSTVPVSSGGRYDGSIFEGISFQILTKPSLGDLNGGLLTRYASVGTDYNVHFFLNCPSMNYLDIGNVTAV